MTASLRRAGRSGFPLASCGLLPLADSTLCGADRRFQPGFHLRYLLCSVAVLSHQLLKVVAHKPRGGLGVKGPSRESLLELVRIDGPAAVMIKHEKQLLQIILVNVHYTQAILKLPDPAGSFKKLIESQRPILVGVNFKEHPVKSSQVILCIFLHVHGHGSHIPHPLFCKSVDNNSHHQVQDSKDYSEVRADKYTCRQPGMVFNQGHSNITPAVTSHHGLENQQVGEKDRLQRLRAEFAILPNPKIDHVRH
mmetsp:Transcript_91490/g.218063  ORF Transcript_91490/g.218063 Transcript_91490/m.218063 type:complete len:251 (-) Transcript_91490:771-1523(-)